MATNVDVLISLDTTGSMSRCLVEARQNITQLIARMFAEVPNLRVGLIAHGDYGDEHVAGSYMYKSVDLTADQPQLVSFIQTAGPTHGYDAPEMYEYVLHKAQGFAWRMESIKCLVMVGDAIPHEPDANPGNLDWRKETDELHKLGVSIYSVQALASGHPGPRMFWKTLADRTNGYHLELGQFSYLRDILLAVVLKQAGDDRVAAYEQELVARPTGLSKSMTQFFDTMLKRAPAPFAIARAATAADAAAGGGAPGGIAVAPDAAAAAGIIACPPAKYQIIDVPADCTIKTFVASQPGLAFKPGMGFYQFTKAETISKKKAVVLMAADGTLYEGDSARTIAGIPVDGTDKKLQPNAVAGYKIFVQSTSYTRKLLGNTKLLYQAADWVDA